MIYAKLTDDGIIIVSCHACHTQVAYLRGGDVAHIMERFEAEHICPAKEKR